MTATKSLEKIDTTRSRFTFVIAEIVLLRNQLNKMRDADDVTAAREPAATRARCVNIGHASVHIGARTSSGGQGGGGEEGELRKESCRSLLTWTV